LPCQIQIGGGEKAWQEGKLVEERAEEKERNGARLGLPIRLSVEGGLRRLGVKERGEKSGEKN